MTDLRRAVGTFLWISGLAAVLSGCAETTLAPGSGGSGLITASAPKTPAFNPFTDDDYQTTRKRIEVIEKPTLAQVMKAGPLPERALGRADAPVTIIKYASLTCPYCRRFQLNDFPRLKRDYIDTGKVRFILREFPIGHASGAATVALRCAPESKYFELYGKYLAQQKRWVAQQVRLDAIYAVAAQAGVSRSQFDACRNNQDLISGLKWVKHRGRELGVIGTPNFFVNGKLIKKVLSYDDLKSMIDPLVAGRVASR